MSEVIVSENMVVSITYRILYSDDTVAEQIDMPVDYIHGVENSMFEKVEAALNGKNIDDTVNIELSPQEGFGDHDPKLTFTDNIENVPPEFRQVGAKPSFENDKGDTVEMVVTNIDNGKLTVDANHPFAGKTMKFIVTIVGVRAASIQELQENQPAQPPSHRLQ